MHMILQDYQDERKEMVVLNGQIYSWPNVTVGDSLAQSLFQCSFSSTVMIYPKVSIR